jgi:hypothetical protein
VARASENDLLAALVATTSDTESLLYILEKDSGAPVIEAFKFTYGNAPRIKSVKPIKA